jgi:hypothetical protein
MSLATFKKKSVIQFGANVSGKPPGGYWLPQGPFGNSKYSKIFRDAVTTLGTSGFSLNGSHRNIGYVGKTYQFSQNGTPFRGTQPCGTGGCCGSYSNPPPVLNSLSPIVLGTQYEYVKPSVLSTKGMLERRFKWINNGQYPTNWVQPNYTGNQVDSASQGVYIHQLSAANMCNVDINKPEKYIDNIKIGGATLCYTTTARFQNYDMMASKGLYTKELQQPLESSQYTLYIQRRCANPIGPQKPFPFRVQTGTNINHQGTSITSVGNACDTSNTYVVPPEWYTTTSKSLKLERKLKNIQ